MSGLTCNHSFLLKSDKIWAYLLRLRYNVRALRGDDFGTMYRNGHPVTGVHRAGADNVLHGCTRSRGCFGHIGTGYRNPGDIAGV